MKAAGAEGVRKSGSFGCGAASVACAGSGSRDGKGLSTLGLGAVAGLFGTGRGPAAGAVRPDFGRGTGVGLALVGGLGMAPGANIGDDCAVFEATHGSAPKYAGLDKVNPSSLILSGAMMLDHLGWKEASQSVWEGVRQTVRSGFVTYDLARQIDSATEVSCSGFAERIVENIGT